MHDRAKERADDRAAGDSSRALARRARDVFATRFRREPDGVAYAPGRVNLIGEHVDYAGGVVVPLAIDRGVAVAFAAREDGRLVVFSETYGEAWECELAALAPMRRPGGWRDFPAAAAWAALGEQEGGRVEVGTSGARGAPGAELALVADLPRGAGLSSSAAVILACLRAWSAIRDEPWDPVAMAHRAQHAETRFVGVPCGLMDPLASACGMRGHALVLDARRGASTPLAWAPGVTLVVLDTGVERALVDGVYADRRRSCERVAAAMERADLRDVTLADLAAHAQRLSREDGCRARHVVEEMARVEEFVAAWERRDLSVIGALLDASHASLRDLYEVSCPELDAAVELARAIPGCVGARMTGAGFGGCAIALVDGPVAPATLAAWASTYRARTQRDGQAFVARADDGVRLLDVAGAP